MIGKVGFVSLGHDSQTRTPFYLVSSEFSKPADEFSDGLLVGCPGFIASREGSGLIVQVTILAQAIPERGRPGAGYGLLRMVALVTESLDVAHPWLLRPRTKKIMRGQS